MLTLGRRTAHFAPLKPESEFLRFCQEAGQASAPDSILRVLDSYFIDFLSLHDAQEDGGLSIGYALWDLDRSAGESHLVACHGFDPRKTGYPIELKKGEGIAGDMLRRMTDATALSSYVVPDIASDRIIAAREILLHGLHYRGAIVFPIFIGAEARGALKVYVSTKIDPKLKHETNRLQTEAARVSAVVALASRMATANLRDNLSARFRDLDLLNSAQPPDKQMEHLRETVEQCLETIRVAISAEVCMLDLGHTMISSPPAGRDTCPAPSTDELTLPLIPAEQFGESTLRVRSCMGGLRFSTFDRHLLDHAVKLLSRYVDKYFTLREFTQKWRKRGVLLDTANKLSSQLLQSFALDVIVDHLLQGIREAFGFYALSFLQVEGDRLVPRQCLPEPFHEQVAQRNLDLKILARCRYEKKIDWTILDCATCRDCRGLTSVAALRRQVIAVPDLPSSPVRVIQVDPGIPATAEYVFPLMVHGKVFGVLDLYARAPVEISGDELYFVHGLCNTAALAIYNIRLVDQLAELQIEETKGEVARDVVHTLTPTVSTLAIHSKVIRDSLAVVRDGALPPARQKQHLRDALQSIEKLGELIAQQQDIVARYDMRSRFGESEDQLVLLGPIVTDVININSLRAEQKGISVRSKIEGSERPIWCSELYMYLILWNLVQNAVKFTRGGHGERVLLTLSYAELNCVIRVQDQGIGIPKANRSRIWEGGFSTIAPGAKTDTSGQGLSIVSDLVRRIEFATIDFTSTVNKGSEFVITIQQGRKHVDSKIKQASNP